MWTFYGLCLAATAAMALLPEERRRPVVGQTSLGQGQEKTLAS
jgi:hypothetical protein